MLRSTQVYDPWVTANLVIQKYGSTAGSGYEADNSAVGDFIVYTTGGLDTDVTTGTYYFDDAADALSVDYSKEHDGVRVARAKPKCAYCGSIYPEGHEFDKPNCSQCGAPKSKGDET